MFWTHSVARSKIRRLSFRLFSGQTGTLCMLLLLCALSSGCDSATVSQITNDTGTAVELELILDRDQWHHGFEPDEYEKWLSEQTDEWLEEQLRVYVTSEGVDLISVDAARFAGRYRMAPSSIIILIESMGSGPYHKLNGLVVTSGDDVKTFSGAEEISKLLRQGGGEGNLWEIKLSSVF